MATNRQRALIIHDASKQLSVSLRSVVIELSLKYGAKIKLLVITGAFTDKHRFHAKGCGLKLKYQTHSSATIKKHKEDIEEEVHNTLATYSKSTELREMMMAADMLKVEFGITVEAGMLKEVAVEYAKGFQATHVILGRKLKKELKYFVENLTCGISKIKSNNSIVIIRPPQLDEASTSSTTNYRNCGGEEETLGHFMCSSCRNIRPWNKPKRKFTYAELQIATNGFCAQNLLSDHGNKAYLGLLNDQRKILIREIPSVTMREDDFQREVRMLEGVRHSNVALLIGSCSDGLHRILVYEYICNGSLNKHLSCADRMKELTWEIRLKIAYGAAKGLEYLHEEGVYGSMRPTNILITHDFQPMLSYYGFSNEYEALGQWSGQLPKRSAMKTFEHLAPEYHETGKELSKADVFAFGVVLLELITGRKTIDDTDGKSYLRWARPLLRQKKYTELTDPILKDSPDVYQLYWLVRVADRCISLNPRSRYSMKKVVKALLDIMNRSSVEEFSPTESEL